MKNRIIVILQLLITGIIAYGQENQEEITLKELSSPNSPAFTILELNPNEVNRPTSTKAMILSFANSLNDNNGVLNDVALEFSPYWFSSHPDLTFDKYFNTKINAKTPEIEISRKILNNIAQTSSFSFGTSNYINDIDSIDGRNVAGGLKFQILTGKPSPSFYNAYILLKENDSFVWVLEKTHRKNVTDFAQLNEEIVNAIVERVKTKQEYAENEKDKIIETLKKHFDDLITSSGLNESSTSEEIKNFLESEIAKLDAGAGDIIIKMRENAISSRIGLIWECAFASSLILPTNELDYSIGNKWGIWSTLTYRTTNEKNDFNLMFRRMGNYDNVSIYNTDIGLSYVINREKYNVSFEGLLRNYKTEFEIEATTGGFYTITEKDYTSRFAFSLQYKLTDYINFTATMGKNFKDKITNSGDLFSLVNLNLVIPEIQTIKLKD